MVYVYNYICTTFNVGYTIYIYICIFVCMFIYCYIVCIFGFYHSGEGGGVGSSLSWTNVIPSWGIGLYAKHHSQQKNRHNKPKTELVQISAKSLAPVCRCHHFLGLLLPRQELKNALKASSPRLAGARLDVVRSGHGSTEAKGKPTSTGWFKCSL